MRDATLTEFFKSPPGWWGILNKTLKSILNIFSCATLNASSILIPTSSFPKSSSKICQTLFSSFPFFAEKQKISQKRFLKEKLFFKEAKIGRKFFLNHYLSSLGLMVYFFFYCQIMKGPSRGLKRCSPIP